MFFLLFLLVFSLPFVGDGTNAVRVVKRQFEHAASFAKSFVFFAGAVVRPPRVL